MYIYYNLLSLIISFFFTLTLSKVFIPFLQRLKYGQTILEVGPHWHKKKQGTPTMGGVFIIIGVVISCLISIPYYYKNCYIETPVMSLKIFAGLGMAVFYGLIGFLDDYIKVVKKRNLGLNPKQKLIFQFLTASIYLYLIYIVESNNNTRNITCINFPFFGQVDFGILYWPISAILIVGVVNSVNLNDGIDGLTSSTAFFVGVFFMLISNILKMFGLSLLASSLVGSCLGFLIWNFYPAKIFMGDTGSLFIGGMICALGFGINSHIILIILSFVYILEMFSVILQVVYFKFTHGKRLFKMSPIHHHFEMIGWNEAKICFVFIIFTVIFGLISFIFSYYQLGT
ncbi:MAG: phospho-N-acetylmuramoyl-pentapeptide-transferase [Candidatus Paraimprobicoccus trichonymphae]|uniref:Phospho-N-acetylmuramoyl-pentapeptide-transferase n=1 Tax=Candidatus Paraimprobicoccus trichonymphae TaxID=3033793 RepID=A0AA48HWI3_9FIRM|nr:MAG: phospho-N-acetylmuramoyl-pentapeptide-transferase [Candidatus Paraimprobicoccus trichonymphae]